MFKKSGAAQYEENILITIIVLYMYKYIVFYL